MVLYAASVAPTAEEQERCDGRHRELYAAALEAREPDLVGLSEEEHWIYREMMGFAPTFQEMIESAIISPDGRPGAPAVGHDGDDQDCDDDDQAFVWRP
jgi:hypothetical protein